MINVDLEMWPGGVNGPCNYSLGRITIANDGTHTDGKKGNYDVVVYAKNGRKIRAGKVKDWPRLARSRMELLIAALVACGYTSNEKTNARPEYITVTRGMSGYFAVHMAWNPEQGGFYEPWATGAGRYAEREGAEREAKSWAESDELEYKS